MDRILVLAEFLIIRILFTALFTPVRIAIVARFPVCLWYGQSGINFHLCDITMPEKCYRECRKMAGMIGEPTARPTVRDNHLEKMYQEPISTTARLPSLPKLQKSRDYLDTSATQFCTAFPLKEIMTMLAVRGI
jgi:hypothetical protein